MFAQKKKRHTDPGNCGAGRGLDSRAYAGTVCFVFRNARRLRVYSRPVNQGGPECRRPGGARRHVPGLGGPPPRSGAAVAAARVLCRPEFIARRRSSARPETATGITSTAALPEVADRLAEKMHRVHWNPGGRDVLPPFRPLSEGRGKADLEATVRAASLRPALGWAEHP